MSNTASLRVFISYSHQDEDCKDDSIVHLATLRRQGKILTWQDGDIEAGIEWDTEIKQQLESAEVILLLLTPHFLASDYCFVMEMKRAIQRHQDGTTRVIPIITKPCDWEDTYLSKLQTLPENTKPITQWNNRNAAFLDVVKGIRRIVESLQSDKNNSPGEKCSVKSDSKLELNNNCILQSPLLQLSTSSAYQVRRALIKQAPPVLQEIKIRKIEAISNYVDNEANRSLKEISELAQNHFKREEQAFEELLNIFLSSEEHRKNLVRRVSNAEKDRKLPLVNKEQKLVKELSEIRQKIEIC